MKAKEKKKKALVLVLLLLAVAGIAGYGVYSYFWTKGSMSASGDVQVATFDVNTDLDSNGFIANGGKISLTCPDSNGNGYETCTGSATITNSGGTSVDVEVLNAQSSKHGTKYMDGTVNSPSFNWTTTTLAPGESKTLEVSVDVTSISNDFDSNTDYESTSGIQQGQYGGYLAMTVSFDLKATQVHD